MGPEVMVFLLVTSLVAGFIDSVAGGGGLLVLPALLFAGLPPQIALGTNKCIAGVGLSASMVNFIINKKVDWPVVRQGLVFSLLGGLLGGKAILLFSNEAAGRFIVCLLPLAFIAILYKRQDGDSQSVRPRARWRVPLICFVIGCYDGFLGPGSSSFLILGLNVFAGLNLLEATIAAKPLTIVSCVTSGIIFIMNGQADLGLALPLALANVGGNYIGSRMVMYRGSGMVRKCLLVSLALVTVSLSYKYFG